MKSNHKLAVVVAVVLLLILVKTYFPGIPACDGIATISEKYYCYQNYAAPFRSTFDCNQLSTTEKWQDSSWSLRDHCNYDKATYKVDPSLCEKLSSIEMRNGCFEQVARTDFSVCEKIVGDQPAKSRCYEQVSRWKEYTASN